MDSKSSKSKILSVDAQKLDELSHIEGVPTLKMLEAATFDGVAKGICMNPGCSYTTDVEPDQDKGYCEKCETNTVKSCLMLAGII